VIIQTSDGKRTSFEVEPSFTITMLKQVIEKKMEAPVHLQKLIYAGKQLDDNEQSLSDYNVQKEAIITLVIRAEPDPIPWTPIQYSGFDLAKKRELTLMVVAGRNLKAADWDGFSDPYCVISCGTFKQQTVTIKKTLNPIWNETIKLKACPNDTLTLELWDEDMISDDFIGVVYIPLSLPLKYDAWYDVGSRPGKKDKVKGDLHVRLIWDDDMHRKLDMDAKMEAFMEKKEKGKS